VAGSLIGAPPGCGMTSLDREVTRLGDSILPCLDAIVRDGGETVAIAACRRPWDGECRRWAIQHIGRIDTPWARALLLLYAADGSSPVQHAAVLNLSTDAARPVLRTLARKNGPLAKAALQQLGIIGNPEDLGFMLEVTRKLPSTEWRSAAYAFEHMAEAAPLQTLRALMGDRDPGVRMFLSDAAANAEPKALYRLGLVALENEDLDLAENLLHRAAVANRTERSWFAWVALARVHYLEGNAASANAMLVRVLEQPKHRAVDPRLILEAEIGTIVVQRWSPDKGSDDAHAWVRVARALRARPDEEQRVLLRRYPEFVAAGQAMQIADPLLSKTRDSLASGLLSTLSGV
jgi:tetratricopeptide (TPR) repeat protein